MVQGPDDFYVIARQPGAENPAIATWANSAANPAELGPASPATVERVEVAGVPGTFQLLNVLSREECGRMTQVTERLGYDRDAAVSLPRSIRHNDSFTWVVDENTNALIWQRCAHLVFDEHSHTQGRKALGLNSRFRFYRYGPGDYFAPHTDGSWPGSRVVDEKLIDNSYEDRWSELTWLLFLTDDFEGGETQFYLDPDQPGAPARRPGNSVQVDVRTPAGGVLCFPHGNHPQHCVHASTPIVSGLKYIIRSDVLFELR